MEGIRVVEDIMAMPGVDTLEGRIGPLLRAQRGGCHFISMPAGLYVAEHAHPKESLIYTVQGRWVLCSGGERRVMPAGSLFWFGDDVATGYETPFDEGAYLLIFKPVEYRPDAELIAYLEELAAKLQAEHRDGTSFRLDELPTDHPARVFARAVAQ